MTRSVLLLSMALLIGCQTTKDDRPKVVDVSQGQPGGPLAGKANPKDLGATYRPQPTRAKPWSDKTEGVTATLVYVTRMGTRNNPKPAAIIFSSDPTNNFFMHKSSPQFTVRRLLRDEMKRLLRQLKAAGFEKLGWSTEENYNAKIGAGRGLHFYQDKKRTYALKESLGLQEKMVFREVEDKIIRITMGR